MMLLLGLLLLGFGVACATYVLVLWHLLGTAEVRASERAEIRRRLAS